MDNETKYRNALLWAFDRFSVDGGMSPAEQRATMREIGNVLTGRLSRAAAYVPAEWSASTKATA